MNDIIIISSNCKEDLIWLNKIKSELTNDFILHTIEINNPNDYNKFIDLTNNLKNYSIISNINTNSFTIKFIKEMKLNPHSLICIDINFEDYKKLLELNLLNKKLKIMLFRKNNNFKTLNDQEYNYYYQIPIIEISKDYQNIDGYIEYLKLYLFTIYNYTKSNQVNSLTLYDSIKEVDKNRKRFKYINNWLFDPNDRLLCFSYNNQKFILKRTTKEKGISEVLNAKKLYKYLNSLSVEGFNIKVVVPNFIEINDEYGYIVSELYGKDLNQYYYEESLVVDKEKLYNLYLEINKILNANNLNYNGFIPRNLIFNKNDIYIIDFEDLNKKNNDIIEITQIISWSYILNFNIKEIIEKRINNVNLDINTYMKEILSNYPNIYKLAIIAESSYNNSRKIDDIINTISEYIEYEIELILDIILYEKSWNFISTDIEEQLYTLVEKMKIIAPFISYNEVKKIVYEDLQNILKLFQNNNISNDLNEVINYAKKKLLNK